MPELELTDYACCIIPMSCGSLVAGRLAVVESTNSLKSCEKCSSNDEVFT
jgi:hypothetical protein